MTPPKKVLVSQGEFFDPRIQGKIHSPEGWPQRTTNIGSSFAMNFPVETITACTHTLTGHETTLHTFTVDPPVNRNIDTFQNGPLVIEGAAIQFISDITTSTNKPYVYIVGLYLDEISHSIVSSPNYGSSGLDLFNNVTFDIDTNYLTGTTYNAAISPGVDSSANAYGKGLNFASWSSDTTWIATSFLRHYIARTTTMKLRVTTQRLSGSATISANLNVFVWGIMLPPLRNPSSL